MENLNLVEILKDCPKGMELDCTVFDNITFDYVNTEQNRIYCKIDNRDTVWFTAKGCINLAPSAKCVIFPKGKTTWEGFIPPLKFKVGQRIEIESGSIIEIGEITDCYYISTTGWKFYIKDQDKFKLVPNKFDITTLKPFDKVLVRNTNSELWRISLFGCFSNEERYFMCMANSAFYQCIPYNEDTKHLVGTADDCDEYYKTWE